MSDVSSINSEQNTSPTPVTQDHTTVTSSSSQNIITSSDSAQETNDLSLQNQELPAPAQKIVDAFLQSDVLNGQPIEKEKPISSVSSSSESSNSTDDNDTSGSETSASSTSAQASTSSSSNKTQSTEGFTSTEQKILDAGLNSKVLSDSQKQQIEEKPEDFVNFVESEGKHAKSEKEKKQDLEDQMAEEANYNPEKDADTTIAENPTAKPSHKI